MKILSTLAAAASLAFTFACAGAPHTVEPPDVNLVSVAPEGLTPFEQRMRADLRFSNPNDFALDFDGIRFDLEVNGRPFARGQSGEAFSLPRLGEEIVSVTATSTLGDLVQQLAALGGRKGSGFDYRITGRLYLVGGGQRSVPFERVGHLGQP
ncbi:MAG: LEA type 2 family protein [Deltaproteobacteria bacterium]|nr:LEA type 2 family protein [Deltaproteobacteria bacterium]